MNSKTETFIVPYLPKPARLQDFGVGFFKLAYTKSALKKAIKKNYITINGITATTARFVSGGETIKLTMPLETKASKKLVFPLKVLFQDDDLAAINKPAGVLVSGNGFVTVANALNQNLTPSLSTDATLPQPVHRLDYATTGVLLIGKTNSSIRALNAQFEQKQVLKTYYAINIGKMSTSGTIQIPIDQKASTTHYTVCKTVSSSRFGQLNLLKLNPTTGRKHQIRKHLQSVGNPILGDRDYGLDGMLLKGKGMYLHAHTIIFTHPVTQKTQQIISPFPKRFTKIFESLNT
ncbi:MAG: RluA family pseudouridine synthase [Bacteroidia bacterium]